MAATLENSLEIPARLRIAGIHRDRLAELLFGFVDSAESHENGAQLIVERGLTAPEVPKALLSTRSRSGRGPLPRADAGRDEPKRECEQDT
jgi:hypothetical protein